LLTKTIKLSFSFSLFGVKNMNNNQVQVKTETELVRLLKIKPCLYRAIRSFIDSSLKNEYPWRIGYQYGNTIEWQKPNKWRLSVFLSSITSEIEFKPLPVPGVYMLRSSQIPVFAELQPLQCNPSLDFVVINGNLAISPPISIPYKDKDKGILTYGLALTRTAPFAFAPEPSVPFARLILTYEIIDTLSEYVEIS
jgi:hypothetical protein